MALLLTGAFSLAFALQEPRLRPAPPALQAPPEPVDLALQPLPIEQVRAELSSSYYQPVPPAALTAPSIPLILEALGDPYTEYLSPDEYQALLNRTARSYFGVGLVVGPSENGLIVTSSLLGPAREAGILPGDVIISIDGQRAGALPFERSLSLIKGEKGTIVRLTVRRDGRGTIAFAVVRREIATPAVRARSVKTRGRHLGYIRILSFPGSAAGRVENATEHLAAKGVEGLILDLRGNPGGLLEQAISVASIYLPSGVVVSTAGAHHAMRVYRVRGDPVAPDLPLVVLVDRQSASAAEIVAAALADHARAVIIGKRTYGKASVQSVHPLSNGAALRLTTATYLTPFGVDIAGEGVRPRVKTSDDPLTRPDEAVVAAEKVLLRLVSERRALEAAFPNDPDFPT